MNTESRLSSDVSSSGAGLEVKKFYRPELDALRFFAFLAVFSTHALPSAEGFYSDRLYLPSIIASAVAKCVAAGGSGVAVFFTLSSYLITALLIREYSRTGTVDVISFYKRRSLRIWPLYFTFFGFCAIVIPFLGGEPLPKRDLLGLATFTENWVTVMQGHMSHEARFVGPLWSVSVEEQFYLIWPVLVLAVGARRIWWLAHSCIALAVVARIYMEARGYNEIQLWQSTLSHLDEIGIGALIAYFYRDGIPDIRTWCRTILLLAGILFIVCTGAPLAIGSGLILVSFAGYSMPQCRFSALLVHLGKISFGLYVFHGAYIWMFDSLYPKVAVVVPLSLLCTWLTAYVSYRWLEMPFLRLKESFSVVTSRSP